MPINRYQIRNVYSLADPELYKSSDKDDPEALLEGVAMAGLVGVLRQLGDLAEFAAEIFRELHEEVMSTAARGHGLLVRVQQLESEVPPIERAFLSQTSHSAFFLNSGDDWHPNRQTTQNLITTGDLPRFVMDSYEECRGPPRLFLLDKFDVGGAGACLKRYTDPSIFKVEASSYEIEITETQREKKIPQTKKKGSRWKGGETPEVSQSSHAKLHQLFLEERVQTSATEAASRVKLKKMPKKFPFDSESGESYMNKLLDSSSCSHEVDHIPSNGSRLEDSSIMGSTLGPPTINTSPCVSSRKVAESQPSYDDLEVHNNQITVDNEIHTNGLQNAYPFDDVASEIDSYKDSDANKHQLQYQLSDSQSIEKEITVSGNSDTINTSTENASPVGANSPPQSFACIEIPFRPRTPTVADNIPVTQNPGHDITNDTCMDVIKVSNVDQVASLEEGSLDTNEVCTDHTEKLDSPRKSEEHQIDKKDKYPMILVPNILETTKNQTGYDLESHSTDTVVSSSQSVTSRVHELSSDTTFNDDNSVTEEQLTEKGDNVLVITDQAEGGVSYFSGRETESVNSVTESVSVADANTNECVDYSVLKDGTRTESEERETESTCSDVKRDDGKILVADSVYSDIEKSAAVVLPVDVVKHDNNGHSVSEQGSKEESYSVLVYEKQPTMELSSDDIISDQDIIIAPCHHESTVFTEADDGVDAQSSFVEDKVDQPIGQIHVPVFEKPLTVDLSSHDINLFDQVKHQSSQVLSQLPPVKVEDPPPFPPMQWRTRKLQNCWSTPMNGGQHVDHHFPPFFTSASIQSPETINLATENQMPTMSYEEVFWPSSSPYSLPLVLDEMQNNNIRPMKIQRPRSPIIDAVATHDKNKLRKVSDQDTTQIPKIEEKDTLLDQIRAKSVNLKTAVQTRPSIQGPTTNLRVAAILEKANAIRQAFAGSDDDDSDNWSDS